MSKPYLNSTDLVASIKRRASIPINQNTFTDEDLLQMANEEMMIGVVPSVLQVHEEFFVSVSDTALEPNKSNYSIPSRAIGNRLRQLSYKDNNGNLFEMTRIQPETMYDNQTSATTNVIYRFFVRGTDIILTPSVGPSITGSLEFSIFLRPNQLVKLNRTGVITNIDTLTGVISLSALPTVFDLNQQYDFIKINSPHKILSYDINPVAIDLITKTITFDPADLPSELAVGDTVNLAGETYVPNIPTDLHVVLAHRVATRCLEALGDTQGLQNANAKLQEMEYKTAGVIDNRVEGSPQKIVNRNNLLRSGKLGRRRNWL